MNRTHRGFSLIELLVVLAVLAILFALVLTATHYVRERSRFTKAQQFSASIHNWLSEDAIGTWSFDEGSGTDIADSSPAKINLTLANATWTEGVRRSALQLNGSQEIVVPKPIINPSPSAVTVAVWVKSSQIGASQVILHHSRQGELTVGVTSNLTPYVSYGSDKTLTADSSLKPNQWHHLAFTWNKQTNQAKLYLDSFLRSSGEAGTSLGNGLSDPVVGSAGGDEYFVGDIDELEVYNQAF